MMTAGTADSDQPTRAPRKAPGRSRYVVVFVVLVIAILAIGHAYYLHIARELRRQAEQQLQTVADLKVAQVAQWRQERLGDGRILDGNAAFEALARQLLQGATSPSTRFGLQRWFESYASYRQYDAVFLYGARGAVRLSVPASAQGESPHLRRMALEALRSGEVHICDFYRDEADEKVHMAVMVPIHDGADAKRTIGVVALRIDPGSSLYPFLALWPSTSSTAETLLARREGHEVVFLSDLRFDRQAALRRRISLDQAEVLAVKAALGQTGTVEGLDYRGEQVIGVLRAIPDSPWYLVARMDVAEFQAGLRARGQMVAAFGLVLMLAVGTGLGLLWRSRQARFYRAQAGMAAALREKEHLLSESQRIAHIGSWSLLPNGQPTWSAEMFSLFGLPLDATVPPFETFLELVHPDDRELVRRAMGANWQGTPTGDIEYRAVRPDGTVRRLCGRSELRRDPVQGSVLTGTVQDVTDRWLAEQARLESERRYRALVEHAPVAILVDQADKVVLVNKASLRLFGATSPDQLLGRSPLELLHPDDHAAIRAHLPLLQDPNGAFPPLEERALRLDGRVVDVEATAAPFQFEGGTAVHVVLTDVSERHRAEAAMQASLREKEALLKEIHHRVKNNLQVITSMLRLEAGRSSEPVVRGVLGEMQNRILSMALLHETLYRSSSVARVDLCVYLNRLANQVFRSLAPSSGRVALHLDLAQAVVEPEQAVPCGLIVNELVSNTLKHGFPQGRAGVVQVNLHQVGDGPQLRLEVADDGVGLPADFEHRRAGSLGLQLAFDLARQLHGNLEIGAGPGARFSLVFVPRPLATSEKVEG